MLESTVIRHAKYHGCGQAFTVLGRWNGFTTVLLYLPVTDDGPEADAPV